MTIKALKIKFHNQLDAIYGKFEVASIFFICTEFYLKISKIQFALNPETPLTTMEYTRIDHVISRLKQQEPIQYILGQTEFYDLIFKVNKNVLIPRPETEELVDWIVKTDTSQRQLTILDIGTGSGCIAISLAKHIKHAKVYALDVSKEALNVAKKNAKFNDVNVTFLHIDILQLYDNAKLNLKSLQFDIIVSNPPYVRLMEKTTMQPNVLHYEPHLAVFVQNNNPLIFYNAITKFAKQKLKHNGKLYFEINQYLGTATKQLLSEEEFSTIILRKDSNGNDRMLKATK